MALITVMLATSLALAGPSQAAPDGPPPPPPPSDKPVLALPHSAPSPGAVQRPPMNPQRLNTLRQYRSQRLVLRQETEISGGNSFGVGGGWGYPGWGGGWGYPGWGWGGTWSTTPITTSRTWGIYQGPSRLSAPQFLETVGDQPAFDALTGDITRHRKRSKTWYGVAGVGLAGIVTGIVGMNRAQSLDTWETFNYVALGGTGLAVGGLIGGSIPAGKASRLETYPSASMSPPDAQQRVDAHNDRLREELGLSADDVWRMESREDSP